MIRRRAILCVITAVVGGFAAGYAWPPPPIPKTDTSDADWSLPSAQAIERYSPEAFAKITRKMQWNFASAGTVSPSDDWRLAGFLIAEDPAILIMEPQSPGKSKRVAIGEQLPDGSTLRVIAGDWIKTQLDTCEKTYQLYQLKAASASSGCETDSPTDASD